MRFSPDINCWDTCRSNPLSLRMSYRWVLGITLYINIERYIYIYIYIYTYGLFT